MVGVVFRSACNSICIQCIEMLSRSRRRSGSSFDLRATVFAYTVLRCLVDLSGGRSHHSICVQQHLHTCSTLLVLFALVTHCWWQFRVWHTDNISGRRSSSREHCRNAFQLGLTIEREWLMDLSFDTCAATDRRTRGRQRVNLGLRSAWFRLPSSEVSLSSTPPRAPAPRNVKQMARPRACFNTKWLHVLETGERLTRVASRGK